MPPTHDLESVWELREEQLFPQLFGTVSRGLFVLERSDFAFLGRADCDPRWLHLGVLEFGPTADRASWVYVTSGGSTPWEQDPGDYGKDEYSWLGVEFLIETPAQNDWAIHLLKRLFAFHVLAMHGQYGDRPGIDYGSRIPIRGPLDREGSALDCVIAVEPSFVARTHALPSGKFDLIALVGVTSDELEFAKAHGTQALADRLKAAGVATLTDVRRPSLGAA